MEEPVEERITRAQAVRVKRRLRDALAAWSSRTGQSQNEFARAIGVSKSNVSAWLNESEPTLPGAKFLLRVPTVLGVTIDWLLTGAGERYPMPASGRTDVLIMEGIKRGTQESLAEMKQTITKIERSLARQLGETTAPARAAFEDGEADLGASIEPRPRSHRDGRR